MNRTIKNWLIVAASLILSGGIVFVITMMNLHWDFTKLSTVKYETNTHELREDFSDISIRTSTADIQFLPSEDGACEVICYEAEKRIHSVSVKDGVLTIEEMDTRKWYDYIEFFSFQTPKITIRLPKNVYGTLTTKQSTGDFQLTHRIALGNVSISTSTGNVLVSDVSADEMKVSVSTGHITIRTVTCEEGLSATVSTGKTELADVTCHSFNSYGNTGNISLKNVVASGICCIERSTGDVSLDGCDAAELSISTDTGHVKGKLLSEKVFIARTDTGRVNVPVTTTGGKCKITTDTGDIVFE